MYFYNFIRNSRLLILLVLLIHQGNGFCQDLNDYTFASFTSTTTGSLEFYTITMSTSGAHEANTVYTATQTPILPAGFSNLPNRSVNVLSETSSSYSLKTLSIDADLPSGTILLIEDLDSSEELRMTFKNSAGTIIDPSVNITQYMPTSGAPSVTTTTSTIHLAASSTNFSFPVAIFQIDVATVRSIEIESRNHPVAGSQVWAYLSAPNSVLPVELMSFTVSQTNDLTADLTWQTASELNSDYFSIERKTAVDTQWQEIGRKEGQGTYDGITNYRFMDHLQESGTYYYRLKQMDIDGRFSYSSTKTLEVDTENTINIYPNPVGNTLYIDNRHISPDSIKLYNMMGVLVREIELTGQPSAIQEVDLQDLEQGIYFLQSSSITRRIIKR